MGLDIIRLDNIAIYARHGAVRQEQELGQRFGLDIELRADLTTPAREDALGKTLDYEAVYHAATQAFTAKRCKLLEHAAWLVLKALFEQFSAEQITVRVRKPGVPIEGILDGVEVELTRRRDEMSDG